MKRLIALVVFAGAAFVAGAALAADSAPINPVTVSPELRAAYWRAAAEVQNLDYQDKQAHDLLNASVQAMRSACAEMKPARDLSQDQKGEPTCIVRPEAKKADVKEKK